MKGSSVLLLACLAGVVSGAKQITFAPPAVIPSPPSGSPAPPANTFQSPGMVFSIIIPGYTVATFDKSKQNSLCNALTSGLSVPTSDVECTIGYVSSFNGTSVMANGYSYFTWQTSPAITNLNTATSQRDKKVDDVNDGIIGSAFPGAVPNCACDGLEDVTTSGAASFSYKTNLPGIPGPVQCDAKLNYNSGVSTAIINQVGIDDGSATISNLGKYCSNPPVAGGVTGNPGQGSCRQYGVIATAAGTTQAIVNNDPGKGVTITNGALTKVDFTGGDPGEGYTSAPTVLVSAPNPLGVTPTFTLDSNAKPSGAATATTTPLNPVANGPYIAAPKGTVGGGICVDTDPAPRCSGSTIGITDAAGKVRNGKQCTDNDFNTGNNCGIGGTPCITLAGGVITGVFFPGSAATYCTFAPVVTLDTNTLQVGVTAKVTATVGAKGVISALNIVSGGSGYRTNPTVIISPPVTDKLGKLCSLNPIPTLSASIAYPLAIRDGVTVDGECRPLGKNTYSNKVCSVPAAPGGEWLTLNTYTCNVISSFIPQSGSSKSKSCGVLPQSFLTVAPTNSPSPTPTPSPSPTPTPSPTATPTPTPTPTSTPSPASKKCTYSGVYRIEAYGCRGQYIAYDIGSQNCKKTNIFLRTSSKASGDRIKWELKATAETGKTPSPAPVVAYGRKSCNNKNVIDLSPANNKPLLVLGSSSTKLRLTPVDASKSCFVVTIQATSSNNNKKYLGYKAPCSNESNFVWSSSAKGSTTQWLLKKV